MPNPISRYFVPFKVVSIIVLVLIALAIVYAGVLSIKNWPGISV